MEVLHQSEITITERLMGQRDENGKMSDLQKKIEISYQGIKVFEGTANYDQPYYPPITQTFLDWAKVKKSITSDLL